MHSTALIGPPMRSRQAQRGLGSSIESALILAPPDRPQGASLRWRAGRLESAATIGLVSVGLGGVARRADGDVEIGGLVGV